MSKTISNITILEGDNAHHMVDMFKQDKRVSLVYMDPPYNTGNTFRIRDSNEIAFEDRYSSLDHYLSEIGCTIHTAWDIVKYGGYLVVHTDPSTSHYLKVGCDAAFGKGDFFAEIIWRYRRWPTKTNNFQKMHDVLLIYRKGSMGDDTLSTWHQLYE